MNMNLSRLILVLITLFGHKLCVGQILELFEENESSSQISEAAREGVRRDSSGNMVTKPDFTLVGTSKIGNRSIVVLEDITDEFISVDVLDGSTSVIPGYPRFEVIEVGSGGAASIRFPSNLTCIEYIEEGVTCLSSDIANLKLTNAQPIDQSENSLADQNMEESGDMSESLVNPFEAILQRSAAPDTDTNENFTPRRINPEDVPPGMRIVSTPFGDRLVEDDQ